MSIPVVPTVTTHHANTLPRVRPTHQPDGVDFAMALSEACIT